MNIPILSLSRDYSSYDLVGLDVGGERLKNHTTIPGVAPEKVACIDQYFVIR